MNARISVDYEPWESVSGKFNEIGRVYNFKNLGGFGTTTRVDFRCRLTVENDSASSSQWAWHKKSVTPFIYLVFDPYLLEQTQHCAAIFGPDGNLAQYKVLTAKVERAPRVSFVIFDKNDGGHLLNILMLGRPLSLNLIKPHSESICRVPFHNDPTFRLEYESFKAALLGESAPPKAEAKPVPAPQAKNHDDPDANSAKAPLQIWTHEPDENGHAVWLVKMNSNGELADAFVLSSFPSRSKQQDFALDLARWMQIKLCDVRRETHEISPGYDSLKRFP